MSTKIMETFSPEENFAWVFFGLDISTRGSASRGGRVCPQRRCPPSEGGSRRYRLSNRQMLLKTLSSLVAGNDWPSKA